MPHQTIWIIRLLRLFSKNRYHISPRADRIRSRENEYFESRQIHHIQQIQAQTAIDPKRRRKELYRIYSEMGWGQQMAERADSWRKQTIYMPAQARVPTYTVRSPSGGRLDKRVKFRRVSSVSLYITDLTILPLKLYARTTRSPSTLKTLGFFLEEVDLDRPIMIWRLEEWEIDRVCLFFFGRESTGGPPRLGPPVSNRPISLRHIRVSYTRNWKVHSGPLGLRVESMSALSRYVDHNVSDLNGLGCKIDSFRQFFKNKNSFIYF